MSRLVVVDIPFWPDGVTEQVVQANAADLSFVHLPPQEPGFEIRLLPRSGTPCIMPREHPLASREAILLKGLCRREQLLIGRQWTSRDELGHALRSLEAPYRCQVEVFSVEGVYTAAGLEVASVPQIIAKAFKLANIEMGPFLAALEANYGIISMPGATLSRVAELSTAIASQ